MKRLRYPAAIDLQPLESDPRVRKIREELKQFNARIEQAERRRAAGLARSRGQKPARSFADRAAALLKGGRVVSSAPANEIEAADEEMDILSHARIAKFEELERVRGEVSSEVCRQFAEMNAQALRQALEAATMLFQALEANRLLRGRLLGAGYHINEWVLPTHFFPAGAAIGNPDLVGMTPAALFKSWLQDKGIV